MRDEKDQFPKPFYERSDGKPVSPEEVLRLEAKMKMNLRVQKVLDEAQAPPAPVPPVADKADALTEYMKTRSQRHLRGEL